MDPKNEKLVAAISNLFGEFPNETIVVVVAEDSEIPGKVAVFTLTNQEGSKFFVWLKGAVDKFMKLDPASNLN